MSRSTRFLLARLVAITMGLVMSGCAPPPPLFPDPSPTVHVDVLLSAKSGASASILW